MRHPLDLLPPLEAHRRLGGGGDGLLPSARAGCGGCGGGMVRSALGGCGLKLLCLGLRKAEAKCAGGVGWGEKETAGEGMSGAENEQVELSRV